MRSLIRFLWMLIVLCIIYVLSIGPSTALEERKVISRATFERIYSPLEKAAKKVASADDVLKDYVRLWKHKEKSPT